MGTREVEKREISEGPAGLEVSGAGLAAALRGNAHSLALAAEAGATGRSEHRRDIDLADILDAIRRDASTIETAEQSPHIVQYDGAAADGLTTVETEPPLAAAPAKPPLQVAASPHGQASATPAHGARPSQLSRIPTVAASLYVKTDATERARRLEEERRRQRNGEKAPEDDEATVSFVVRVSRQG